MGSGKGWQHRCQVTLIHRFSWHSRAHISAARAKTQNLVYVCVYLLSQFDTAAVVCGAQLFLHLHFYTFFVCSINLCAAPAYLLCCSELTGPGQRQKAAKGEDWSSQMRQLGLPRISLPGAWSWPKRAPPSRVSSRWTPVCVEGVDTC